MKIHVVPYDTGWPARYEAEAKRIRDAIGDIVVALHHIGSTSVSGLSAKPIIDMLAEVSGVAELDSRTHVLESLGYESLGEHGIRGRRYFRRRDASGVRTHHMHAFDVRSPQVARHLAFRDYLIAHPAVARAYGELKQQVAARSTDMEAYMAGKDSFIKLYESEALAWRAPRSY